MTENIVSPYFLEGKLSSAQIGNESALCASCKTKKEATLFGSLKTIDLFMNYFDISPEFLDSCDFHTYFNYLLTSNMNIKIHKFFI